MSDFGVGKTLMKKHMALKLSQEFRDRDVSFCSFSEAVKSLNITSEDIHISSRNCNEIHDEE